MASSSAMELRLLMETHDAASKQQQQRLLEAQGEISRLQDELEHASAIRKAQLSELGLLRAEEKQITEAQHDAAMKSLADNHLHAMADQQDAHCIAEAQVQGLFYDVL